MTLVRRPRSALVVDDSAGARRRIATVLRLGGWRVHEAVGMVAALRSAAGLDLDLVVTDMAMQRGNGPLLLRALRQSGCRARFLAVSSQVTDDIRARAAAAGAAGCLAKPVDPRLLVDVLLGLPTEPETEDRGPSTATLHIQAERLDLLDQLRVAAHPARLPRVAVGCVPERPVLAPATDRAMPSA